MNCWDLCLSSLWLLSLHFYFGRESDLSLSPLHFSLVSPVHSDGCHGVDAGEDSCDWEEVVEAAVSLSKVPLAVQRVDEVDESIESSHGGIREGQIHQEVICHRPHALVSQDNPDDDKIPKNGHCHHATVSQRPQGNAPGRLHELIGEVACWGGYRGRSICSWCFQSLSPGITFFNKAHVPPAARAHVPLGCGGRSHLGRFSPLFQEWCSSPTSLSQTPQNPHQQIRRGKEEEGEVSQHSRYWKGELCQKKSLAMLFKLLEML